MNEIKINNTSLKIKEYNGQRVVTFKDVDTVHNRPEGTASRNFRTNKTHFIEGEDFFKICADEIRRIKIFDISPKAQSDIILLTESGYLMLVKSYFKVQRIQKITDSYMIENPAERARRWAEEYEEKLALEQKIEQDKPLVEYASQIQTSEDTISMAEMAKIAASNHSEGERADKDYYCTPPNAVEELLKRESFNPYILEPAVGGGHIADLFKSHGYKVQGMDIVDRGYEGTIIKDFLTSTKDDLKFSPDIITNPPYSKAAEFVKHALDISMNGAKVAMFLKIQFLESKKRYELFKKYPPKKIYVFVNRVNCGKNGVFGIESSAVCYAWFIWEKGYNGLPEIDWIA